MARVRAEENAGSDLSFFENWRMLVFFFNGVTSILKARTSLFSASIRSTRIEALDVLKTNTSYVAAGIVCAREDERMDG